MTEIFTQHDPAVVAADPRRTVHSPGGASAGNIRCIKFRNPDMGATWDFWLMLISQRLGDSAQLITLIPTEGGGYRKIASRIHTRDFAKVDHIETYEAESLSFGFVQMNKMKLRRFYQGVRERLFITRVTTQDFDAEGKAVGEAKPAEHVKWPDLPGDVEVSNLLRSMSPARHRATSEPLTDLRLGLFFPQVETSDSGELEVADGEIVLGGGGVAALAPANGVHIETSFQEGVPSLLTHDYYLHEDGSRKRLFGDRCAQDAFRQVIEIYKDRNDRGFFRSKRKLTIIRKELRVDTFTWSDT